MSKIKIYNISQKKLNELLIKCSKYEETEHFLFLSKYGKTYIALDNEYGMCLMEDFSDLVKALCWLVRKDYSAEEINKLMEDEVCNLISNEKYVLIPYKVYYGL